MKLKLLLIHLLLNLLKEEILLHHEKVQGNERNFEAASSGSAIRTQRRISKEPEWMKDHVTGEGLFDSDEVEDLIMYTKKGDLSTYEEAAKSST